MLLSATTRPALLELRGDITPVHDPAIIKANDKYYVFSTGAHIPIRCSADLHTWTRCGNVFNELPEWSTREIPGAKTAWAPDISVYKGTYRLYYAISTFGHNDSAIGLATSKLPDANWTDEGMVLRSHGTDDWNAIDPNLATDAQGRQWLVFGSFWSGIKMRRVDNDTGKLSLDDTRLYSLASRHAIEAPFLVHHGSFYYLFVSFDFCCRGVKSTYKVAVGRSQEITGPYADASDRPMMDGGGTIVVSGTPRWPGAGHEAVLLGPPEDLLVFHAYDGATGRPSLQISTLTWDNDWPHAAALPGSPEGASL